LTTIEKNPSAMRSTVFVLLILFASSLTLVAQEKRINLYGGYAFDDGLDVFNDSYQYLNGTVKGGFQYGAGLEFVTDQELGLELLYIGQQTEMPLTFDANFGTGPRRGTYDVGLNYALISINKYSRSGMIEGYGGLMIGCLFSNATNAGNADSLGNRYGAISTTGRHFSWGLKLGANFWVGKNVAIKLQGQFISTTEAFGGSSYYGYYGYYEYYSYLNLFQWNFSSGLVFRFGGS
jgi:hypothetical protein